MTTLEPGERVRARAESLSAQGRDANQIAKILCDEDTQGHNYGIGILLDGRGQALPTSETLLRYTLEEVRSGTDGVYRNSAALLEELKVAVLEWQRIPSDLWDAFLLLTPSDAGTGALKSAVEIALGWDPELDTVGVAELGWPAYAAIARSCRVGFSQFPNDGAFSEKGVLPVYQAGPMNTTGHVPSQETVIERAETAARDGRLVILDRAYTGFEFAGQLAGQGYDEVIRMSCERQLAPFFEHGTPALIAISPTKCFCSFALRPCGMLLAFVPDAAMREKFAGLLNPFMRARGSSFEHPATRAFIRAMVNDRPELERDHAAALARVAEAESIWGSLAKGTAMESLFSAEFAGLFRNPAAADDADIRLYGEHIYPVFSHGRCRINVTGIPADRDLQRTHVSAFCGCCGKA